MEASRLDRIHVATHRETIEMPWSSRQALLERLRERPDAASAVSKFEAVGASRPVKMTPDEKLAVLWALHYWLDEVTVDGLPPGVMDLRNALIDDADRGEL